MKKKQRGKIKTAVYYLALTPGALLAWLIYCLAVARARRKAGEVRLYSSNLRNILTGALTYLALSFWLLAFLSFWLFNSFV